MSQTFVVEHLTRVIGPSCRSDDVRTGADQGSRRLEPEPRVAAGDHDATSAEVDAGHDLVGFGGPAEAGRNWCLRGRHRVKRTHGAVTDPTGRLELPSRDEELDLDAPLLTERPPDDVATTRSSTRPTERHGTIAAAACVLVVAASWAPRLWRPLGADHVGNVAARYGLHTRNLFERGLVDSTWGAAWEPYRSQPYAHHPPLRNAVDAAVGLLPGESTFQLLVASTLLALVAVPAGTALLRLLGFSWPATLLSVGALATTGYFWVYGPVMFDLGPILAVAAGAAWVRTGRSPTWAPMLVGAGAFVLACASWPGVAFAAGLVAWLARGRGFDSTVRWVAAGSLSGAVVSATYTIGISGAGRLADQTATRTVGGDFSTGYMFGEIVGHVTAMLPWWYVVAFVPAVIAGLVDRRSRDLTAASAVMALAWTLLLYQGAFVHDYWSYLLVVPGLLGGAALVDGALTRTRRPATMVAVAAMGVAWTFGATVFGGVGERYVWGPSDAGAVLQSIEPPSGQRTAWLVGLDHLRLASYYWNIRATTVDDGDLVELDPTDLVVVELDRAPAWYPTSAPPAPVARVGDYAVVEVAALRDAIIDDPTTP